MSGTAILSAREPGARIVRSQLVPAADEILRPPAISLGGGQFTLTGFINGRADLLCPRGHRCGVFVNPDLAQSTAEFLSR